MWNEFLPISMPIAAVPALSFSGMLLVVSAPCQLRLLTFVITKRHASSLWFVSKRIGQEFGC